MGHLGYDLHLAVEPVFQSLQVVLAEIIILAEDADFSLPMVLQQMFGVEPASHAPAAPGSWRLLLRQGD